MPLTSLPFVTTGAYPTRSGNHIWPWIDGEPAFRRICEAIEAAQQSVWATITFMWPSFRMPDGRGTALDVLERAARRGIDVRIIFWRPDDETASLRRNAFWGSPEHFDALSQRYPQVKIRWDRAHPGYCQHQKTWLIDANRGAATSFVGGINLNTGRGLPLALMQQPTAKNLSSETEVRPKLGKIQSNASIRMLCWGRNNGFG
jgi:phosphatidylserine/phosphatidylglycerophosphate/cardiolipin synthase-like enzyme